MIKNQYSNLLQVILILSLSFFPFTSCSNDDEDKTDNDDEETVVDYTGLVINEICGLQDPDDDWVELYNTTNKAIDIGGLQLVKTDEDGIQTIIYTAPDSTIIDSHDYFVIATLSSELSAGISNTKQVGIALIIADGTFIDNFNRDTDIGEGLGHILGGSYARVPNGTGKWIRSYSATRGSANKEGEIPNIDYTGLVINEVCGLQDPDDDWVELYNTSSNEINLSSVQIIKTDEDGINKSIYIFPSGKKIAAGEYLVVATLSGELTAAISNSKQVGITLIKADGETTIDEFNRNSDIGEGLGHILGGSYARIPDGTGEWKLSYSSTRGTVNEEGKAPSSETDYTGLVLNEVNGNSTKFVEIYNNSDKSIDISGVMMKKNNSTLHTIPVNTIIASKSRLTFISGVDFSNGISAKKSLIMELVKPDGKTQIDVFKNLNSDGTEVWDTSTPKYDASTTEQSFGRYPDGTGTWYLMTITQNTVNTAGTVAIEW